MDDVIVFKGKEYSKEEITEMVKQIMNRVKSIVEKVLERARKLLLTL